MTFADSVKVCLDKYTTMQGRASRSEYWWFVLFYSVIMIITLVVFSVIGFSVGGSDGELIAGSIGYVLVIGALICPLICVLVRRLHDTGHSGFWYFISFVPFVGGFWLLFLLLKDSEEENEYGLPVY